MIDLLCPLNIVVSDEGVIEHAGPTVRKLFRGSTLEGRKLLDVLSILRPRAVGCVDELHEMHGRKLHIELNTEPATSVKGVAVGDPDGNGLVLNLSFGISIRDVVRDFGLTARDFASTDLAMELLYVIEAQSSAIEASRKLNLRLRGAKVEAEEQAFTDMLTGLKNRRAMDHALLRLLNNKTPLALMHVDLDFFKAVNDTMGHAAGDLVLVKVAEVFEFLCA